MSELCECFPPANNLAVMAQMAQAGLRQPFVGTGDPDTVLACTHGEWVLGDVIAEPKPACQELTKAGNACQGKPGPDGYCAAHKQTDGGDGAAGAVQDALVDADPPA